MYYINACSPLYDSTQDGTTNLRATRILFSIDLLILCLAFNLISLVLKKRISDLKLEEKEGNKSRAQQLQLSYKKWQQQFLLCLGDHVVSLGFVMCFSPYQFQLVLALSFIVVRTVYQIRLHKCDRSTKQLKTILRIINMSLLLCAMVGLSRTTFSNQNKVCDDSAYRF